MRDFKPWWPVYLAIVGMALFIFFAGKYAEGLLSQSQTAHVAPGSLGHTSPEK